MNCSVNNNNNNNNNNKPTRVTDFSATLNDNIVTNVNLNNSFSYIIYADISDHFPVFLQTRHSLKHTDKPVTFYKRIFQTWPNVTL